MGPQEIIGELKSFFVFLFASKLRGFNFCVLASVLVFLPNQGYYQTLQLNWQKPQVAASHFVLPPPVLYPQNITGINPPALSAQGVIVFDLDSSVRLFEKRADEPFLPASTVKIMTALITLESFAPEEALTVPKLTDEGQDIKLVEGEKMTVENLLYALLVASANDAAETLVANYPGGRRAFIGAMNQKAQSLSLANTHFTNPTGIDELDQYTSPFDLALLTEYALVNPLFARMVATSSVRIESLDGQMVHEMTNINQLLGKIPGVRGVKTGWTQEAGECLVTYVERDGKKIIIVVLGSQDRFGETEKIINWVFENFEWKE